MPDLIPFAVIHIGVSVALAAILILVHRRLHRADFLLYWAMFWLAIAANLVASRVGLPLSRGTAVGPLFTAFAASLFPLYPVLMICAALSLGGGLSQRAARILVTGSGAFAVVIGVYVWISPPPSGTLSPFATYRPLVTSLAVAFFACRLALKGQREAGPARPALVALSMLYSLHNLALGWTPAGLHIYPPGGYAPWSATVGILFQFGLTVIFAYTAIERAGAATREARESDRRLRSLLESVGVAGLIVDRQGRVEFCNDWLLQTLEQPVDAVVGSLWFESYVPEPERRRVRQVFDAGIETGRWPAINQYPIQTGGDREVMVQWYHTSLRDTEGAIIGAAGLGLDLSQQRQLEEQIRQVQKMETLGRLAAGVAHDFNNNLTVINGVADLLLLKVRPGDPIHQHLKDIRHSGELAAALTRELLTFARRRKGDPRPVSLNQTVKQNEKMLRRVIREEIVLEIATGPGSLSTMAEPGQLDQMLLNLVVNANDAISGPGKISLRTDRFSRSDSGTAAGEAEGPRDFVVLSVEDTGSGMSERTRQRIFEPFFTTKAEGKGTGLGLATVHSAVVQAGGWIDVTSQPGVGSKFTVYFPRVAAPNEEVRPETLPAATQSPDDITVLLVEDQDLVRRFASDVLVAHGYRVVAASTGPEALSFAADKSLDISLLVTDVVMPQMSGGELARRVEQIRPGLRTLFVSFHSLDWENIANQPSLERGFLQKPYTPEQLCAHVERMVKLTD
jgi:two-component system, cell cycle sensor histidine kinase and response regulator CckA